MRKVRIIDKQNVEQIGKQRCQFWCKKGGKMAHYIIINTQTFCGSPKEYETQKVARVKGSRKGKRKGQEEKFGTGNRPNFGLCAGSR